MPEEINHPLIVPAGFWSLVAWPLYTLLSFTHKTQEGLHVFLVSFSHGEKLIKNISVISFRRTECCKVTPSSLTPIKSCMHRRQHSFSSSEELCCSCGWTRTEEKLPDTGSLMIKVLWCHLVVTCKNDSRQLHCFCIRMTHITVNSYFGWTETEFKKFLHQAVSRLCVAGN